MKTGLMSERIEKRVRKKTKERERKRERKRIENKEARVFCHIVHSDIGRRDANGWMQDKG